MLLPPPRYEFRIFAENLVPLFETLKELVGEPLVRESDEWYFVSEFCWDTNLKIRDDKLDIKILLQEREGLEFWVPKDKLEFPLTGGRIKDDILDDILDVIFFEPKSTQFIDIEQSYTLADFLELMKNMPNVFTVPVRKKRYGFVMGDCIMEFAEVIIEKTPLHTVAVESVDAAEVKNWMRELDIDRRDNTNYLEAIKKIVGLEPPEGHQC